MAWRAIVRHSIDTAAGNLANANAGNAAATALRNQVNNVLQAFGFAQPAGATSLWECESDDLAGLMTTIANALQALGGNNNNNNPDPRLDHVFTYVTKV